MTKRKVSKLGAVGLSLICPGLGHLYLRRWMRAFVFLGITAISIWKISQPVRAIMTMVNTLYPTVSLSISNGYVPDIDLNVDWLTMVKQTLLWGLIFTITFFWALIDAFVLARQMQHQQREKQKEEHA